MLTERQVRHLLLECEARTGSLKEIRDGLLSRDPKPFIWELVLLDSLLAIGKVEYQQPTASGKTPDFLVTLTNGESFWIEAAYLPTHSEMRDRVVRAFEQHLAKAEKKNGITWGSISTRVDGDETPRGCEARLPDLHQIPQLFKTDLVRAFFRDIRAQPEMRRVCDLRPVGYTIRISYGPSHSPAGTRSGGGRGLVGEDPKTVEAHPLFETLTRKAEAAKDAKSDRPYIICVGSENRTTFSNGVRSMSGITPRAVTFAVLRDSPDVSTVLIVSIQNAHTAFQYSRQSHCEGYLNDSARAPLTPSIREAVERLSFRRVEYTKGWDDWSGTQTSAQRRKRRGGSMKVHYPEGGRLRVSLPAHFLAGLLAGEITLKDIADEYSWDEKDAGGRFAGGNPFRRALEEHRHILGVHLDVPSPRTLSEPMVTLEYGPPEPPVLAQAKRDRQPGPPTSP